MATDIMKSIDTALDNKKGLVQDVMTTDTWKLTMFLEFSTDKPDVYFMASFHYKSGAHGSSVLRYIPNEGKLLAWQSPPSLRIPKALHEVAFNITQKLYSSTSYKQISATSYEKLAYSVQNMLRFKGKIQGTTIEDFQQSSVEKLAKDVEKRHSRSNKVFICGVIYNKQLDTLQKGFSEQRPISPDLKEKCLQFYIDIRSREELLVKLVQELQPYIKTVGTYNYDFKPVGYILNVQDVDEINVYDIRGNLCDKAYPTPSGLVILNRISTIAFLSTDPYTGKIKNARLELWSKSNADNISYMSGIYPGQLETIGTMKEVEVLSLLGEYPLYHYLDIYKYLYLIRDELRKENKPTDSVPGLMNKFNRRFKL